jgi:hypothetical protein
MVGGVFDSGAAGQVRMDAGRGAVCDACTRPLPIWTNGSGLVRPPHRHCCAFVGGPAQHFFLSLNATVDAANATRDPDRRTRHRRRASGYSCNHQPVIGKKFLLHVAYFLFCSPCRTHQAYGAREVLSELAAQQTDAEQRLTRMLADAQVSYFFLRFLRFVN